MKRRALHSSEQLNKRAKRSRDELGNAHRVSNDDFDSLSDPIRMDSDNQSNNKDTNSDPTTHPSNWDESWSGNHSRNKRNRSALDPVFEDDTDDINVIDETDMKDNKPQPFDDPNFDTLLYSLSRLDVDQTEDTERCPLCNKKISAAQFGSHVYSCLDDMPETKRIDIADQIREDEDLARQLTENPNLSPPGERFVADLGGTVCPVCGATLTTGEQMNSHVNSCLDNQEKKYHNKAEERRSRKDRKRAKKALKKGKHKRMEWMLSPNNGGSAMDGEDDIMVSSDDGSNPDDDNIDRWSDRANLGFDSGTDSQTMTPPNSADAKSPNANSKVSGLSDRQMAACATALMREQKGTQQYDGMLKMFTTLGFNPGNMRRTIANRKKKKQRIQQSQMSAMSATFPPSNGNGGWAASASTTNSPQFSVPNYNPFANHNFSPNRGPSAQNGRPPTLSPLLSSAANTNTNTNNNTHFNTVSSMIPPPPLLTSQKDSTAVKTLFKTHRSPDLHAFQRSERNMSLSPPPKHGSAPPSLNLLGGHSSTTPTAVTTLSSPSKHSQRSSTGVNMNVSTMAVATLASVSPRRNLIPSIDDNPPTNIDDEPWMTAPLPDDDEL